MKRHDLETQQSVNPGALAGHWQVTDDETMAFDQKWKWGLVHWRCTGGTKQGIDGRKKTAIGGLGYR